MLESLNKRGRDSSVDIATRYGLDGPGIESRWGRDFPQPSRPALGPTQSPQCRDLKLVIAIPLNALRALVACYKENLYLIGLATLHVQLFVVFHEN